MVLFDGLTTFFIKHQTFTQAFQIFLNIFLFGLPVLSMLIFPYYIRVFRKNRKRDEQFAIFPITNYFYKTTFITESLLIIGVLISVILMIIDEITGTNAYNVFFTFYWAIWIQIRLNITLSLDFFTFLLALYRFLLYFFPKKVNFLTPSKRKGTFLLVLLHLAVFSIVFRALLVPGTTTIEEKKLWDGKMQTLLLSLNLLVLLGSLPYFLIICSIRRLTRASSNRQSSPEKYIKYQIVVIFICKICILPFLIAVPNSRPTNAFIGEPMFLLQLACESITTPLMIQFAYLLSNKTNWETLKTEICFCCCGMVNSLNSRVEPTESAYTEPMENIPTGQPGIN